MRLLRKLARLEGPEAQLLAEAAVVVPIIRLALTLLPFRVVHRGIAVAARALHRPVSAALRTPERIAWAVTVVAARVPHASCLTQALSATLLLVRHGQAAILRLGVAKNGDGTLRAHAWLETGGQAILGEPAAGEFVSFPPVALS